MMPARLSPSHRKLTIGKILKMVEAGSFADKDSLSVGSIRKMIGALRTIFQVMKKQLE
jgi:hypothetical protein